MGEEKYKILLGREVSKPKAVIPRSKVLAGEAGKAEMNWYVVR